MRRRTAGWRAREEVTVRSLLRLMQGGSVVGRRDRRCCYRRVEREWRICVVESKQRPVPGQRGLALVERSKTQLPPKSGLQAGREIAMAPALVLQTCACGQCCKF